MYKATLEQLNKLAELAQGMPFSQATQIQAMLAVIQEIAKTPVEEKKEKKK